MYGTTLKFLKVIDEYSRLCLAIRVGRRCRSADVIGRDLGAAQALPTAHSSADRQWSGIHRLRLVGVECRDRFHMAYIPPSSPEDNSCVESSNNGFRYEFLNFALFTLVYEAKTLAEQHRIKYHTYRAH